MKNTLQIYNMDIKSKFNAVFKYKYFLLAIVLSVILLRALEIRLPSITRNFWEDEIHHNYLILWADSLYKILKYMGAQSQPFLDFFLRKIVWINLFGYNEITFRIPSLFYSLLSISFGYLGAYYLFLKYKISNSCAIACSIIVAVWILNNPTEIHYASEARHYSFTAFISLLWFYFFLFYNKKNRPIILFIISLIFANTHFFSFPIILSGYFFDSIKLIFQKDYKSSIINLLVALTIIWITTKINFSAWYWLANAPPGKSNIGIYQSIVEGDRLWRKFINYLSLPLSLRLIIIVLFVNIRSINSKKILYFLFLILPVFFIYVKINSSYPFGRRYFTPFFGLGFVILVYFIYYFYKILESVPDVIYRLLPFDRTARYLYRLRQTAIWIFLIFISYQLNVQKLPSYMYNEIDKINIPPKNFSSYYKIYQELKNEKLPILLINEHCWANDIPKQYFEYLGGGYRYGFEVVSARGCETSLRYGYDLIKKFIKNNPFGIVVLDMKRDYSMERFHNWETTSVENIPGWLKNSPLKFRYTRRNSAMVIQSKSRKEINIFLRCAHPDINKKPVMVKIRCNAKLIRKEKFLDNQWKKMLIGPCEIKGLSILTFQVSRTWNPKEFGYSEDNRNLGVAVAVPRYDSLVPSKLRRIKSSNAGVWILKNMSTVKEIENIAKILGFPLKIFNASNMFYEWETWDNEKIPGWPNSAPLRVRWTASQAIMDIQEGLENGVILFLKCAHPRIVNDPVRVKIMSDNILIKNLLFVDNQWKKAVLNSYDLRGTKKLTIQVSRTWNPKEFGYSEDDRDLGVAVAMMNLKIPK